MKAVPFLQAEMREDKGEEHVKGTHRAQRPYTEAPGGQVAGPWQAAALENRKRGKSPDGFVNLLTDPKAKGQASRITPKRWPPEHSQDSRTYCPVPASLHKSCILRADVCEP